MKMIRSLGGAVLGLAILAIGCGGQSGADMVVSSDSALARAAASLLPDLVTRSGLPLKAHVRLEVRSREELVRYLESKLDEDLPQEEAQARVDVYARLGLVPHDLDLRAVLLGLYTEQVAGFYEPDSTALFVLDDQPEEALHALLVHELVHALQDQSADLGMLTDPAGGSDRAAAAQAAIEGHATLVMLEYMTEQMTGSPIDLGQIPDFSAQLRPALEGLSQFPALASAPRIIREALLFPYLEGAGYVQRLWVGGSRVAPFGANLPSSTEQVMGPAEAPFELELTVQGGRAVLEDVLGRFELGIFLDEVVSPDLAFLSKGWDGDRYVLVEGVGGARSLVSFVVWSDRDTRDRFTDAVEGARRALGTEVQVDRIDIAGRSASVITIGPPAGVSVSARESRAR
ncbi:MAG: hypothetical protein O2958_08960 [Gemmatimonadetes bacterium]|nr:hypothetical protein [Gemmatimonadota bacterium]MDA1104776.1 hypothetical protein [Gemmatimonadota bacterium]